LYCPVCDNIPLDVCGTAACADWRDEIRAMLVEGRSEEEIKTYFVERYGRRVLATPQREGIDLLVWILPPLGVLVGAVVLILTIRRMAPGSLGVTDEPAAPLAYEDRKSTRLNSSHVKISYAVFCLKKKKQHKRPRIT